jgi:16S rRNA (adenine1518-N6/adenine1519-N6)-dimethyltransferase
MPEPKSPRQTLSYLRNLFEARGIAPRRQLGQNFLIDLNLHELIARTAEIAPTDVILEVGPGAGALTTLMAQQASAVVAVDLDPAMAALTRDAASGYPNVRVLNLDALAGKNALNPVMLDTVRAGLAVGPDRRLKLVANLPYNVATPLISNLLVHPDLSPVRMVVTIQREVAERLTAAPGTSPYSGLSVIVQAMADVEIVRILSPKVFWPRPKVESAIVKIDANPEKRAAIPDLDWFKRVVRRIFLHRRKNLRGVLYAEWKDRWAGGKPEVDAMLTDLGLTTEAGQIRAEAMDVPEFLALAEALAEHVGKE